MEKAIEIKRRAQRCIQNGDLDGALAEYEKLVGFEDSDPYNFVLLADLLYKKGEQTDAADRYLSAVAAYEKASLYKNAIAVCKKMTRLSLSPAKVLNALANLHALDGLAGEAALYYVQYAEHMVRSSAPAEAAHALRKAFDVCQDNIKVLEQLSEAWVLAGDQHQAAEALVEAADQYRQRGQERDATRVLTRAAKLDASVDGLPAEALAVAGEPGPETHELGANEIELESAPDISTPEPQRIERVESAQELTAPAARDGLDLEPTARGSVMMARPDFSARGAVEGFDSGRHDSAAPATGNGSGAASPADFAVSEEELAPRSGETGDDEDARAGDEVRFVIDEASLSEPTPASTSRMAAAPADAGDEVHVYEIGNDEEPGTTFAYADEPSPVAAEPEPEPERAPEEDEDVVVILEEEEDEPETTAPAPAASAEPATTAAPGLRFEPPVAAQPAAATPPVAAPVPQPPAPAPQPAPPAPQAMPAQGPTTQEIGLQQVEALLTSAQEQFRAGDREKASGTLARAAQAYEVLGRFDSAATIYRSLGRSATVAPSVLELWLINCERRGDKKEAATVACEMGDRALNAGDESEARRWFERAMVFDAQNDTARRRLQRLAGGAAAGPVAVASPAPPAGAPPMEAGRVEVAVGRGEAVTFDLSGLLAEFQRGVEAQLAGDAQSHYDLGMAYREMGLLEQAVDSFRVAVGEPRLAPRALEMIGRCHIEQGRWAEAVGEFRRALQHPIEDGGDGELRFHYAHALVELGESEAALAEYERVSAQMPGFEDVNDRIAALRRVLGRA